MQSFILMQITYKRDGIGDGKIFGHKFSRLDPDCHNIQLYDMLMVCPLNPFAILLNNVIDLIFSI